MIANLAIAQEQEIINYREKAKLIAKDLASLTTNTKIVFSLCANNVKTFYALIRVDCFDCYIYYVYKRDDYQRSHHHPIFSFKTYVENDHIILDRIDDDFVNLIVFHSKDDGENQ